MLNGIRLTTGVTIVLASLFAQAGFAQVPDAVVLRPTSALAGVVSDTIGRPIQHATVLVDGQDFATVSDDSGRFHLGSLPPGTTSFTVMRIGFRPVTFETELWPDTTLVVAVRLRPVPTLSSVEVTAARVAERLTRAGFYERRRTGRGSFVTPERIDSIIYSAKPSQLLRDVRGIEVVCGMGATCTVQTRMPPHCLWLFVDGRYTNDQIDHFLTPDAIAAIEIYERPSLVPLEFQAPLPPKRGLLTVKAGCGALVVWTKTRAG